MAMEGFPIDFSAAAKRPFEIIMPLIIYSYITELYSLSPTHTFHVEKCVEKSRKY